MSNTENEDLNTLCDAVESNLNSDLELNLSFKCRSKHNQNTASLLLMFFNDLDISQADQDRIVSWVTQKGQDLGYTSIARDENVKISDVGLILFSLETP
jgi:hypothetical protein